MRRVHFRAPGFHGFEAGLAEGFLERLVGLHRTGIDALALRTASIQTFGLRRPVQLVACDGEMTVLSVRVLPPNRIAWVKGARLIIELPIGIAMPAEGTTLEMSDV